MTADLHTRLRSAIMTDLSRHQSVVTAPGTFSAELVAFVIRACRADLERLERHKPINDDHSPTGVGCNWCEADPGDRDPWPCIEVRSLAGVYGIEVSP